MAVGLHGYVCFYDGQKIEVKARSSYSAVLEAREKFNAPKSKQHMVHCLLAELPDGTPVVHRAVD